LFAIVLTVAPLIFGGCYTPRGTPVTYKNEMQLDLTVTSDDFFLVTLLPGQKKSITTKESLLPDRIRAYDPRGNLVFDRTVTWEELKAANFVLVLK